MWAIRELYWHEVLHNELQAVLRAVGSCAVGGVEGKCLGAVELSSDQVVTAGSERITQLDTMVRVRG